MNETHDADGKQAMFAAIALSKGVEAAERFFSQHFGDATAVQVRHAHERKVGIIASRPGATTLRRPEFQNWYAGPNLEEDRFWPPLRTHLLEVKKWDQGTVDALDKESTNVIRLLRPVGGEIDVRGLVVGYVQSGKTANYTALVAKAADVGYRLIIVLAGVHNSLRRQTQERLQAELIDLNDSTKALWHTLTRPLEDFMPSGTNTDAFLADHSNQRILLVVKKNARVLDRLVKWLRKGQLTLRDRCPALIIDDEADQATVNTAKVEPGAETVRRSAINRLIVSLKRELPRSAYVAYTATPFANVLIDTTDSDDLYPRDFIVSLNKPLRYFGAELFFGRDLLLDEDDVLPQPPDVFREVTADDIAKVRPPSPKGGDSFSPAMADSLRNALHYFVLAVAARRARGQIRKHSSMLVHTTLNTAIHGRLRTCIEAELARLAASHSSEGTRQSLKQLWEEENTRVTVPGLPSVGFESVQQHLPAVLERLQVVVDNAQSDTRLYYKSEKELGDDDKIAHIAVGGNTLSRGLTLEGLIVSYFVRSASAYDTLLQMGRWFGYRAGYEDLPRLWMTDELRSDFHELATVEEEVRAEIARYSLEGRTPTDFAIRIRQYPSLAITSRLKMQHAVVAIDYSGLTRQTRTFYHEDEAWLKHNWDLGGTFLERIFRDGFKVTGSLRYVEQVPVQDVLKFLEQYKVHELQTDTQYDPLQKYINAQNAKGRCKTWTVALASLQKGEREVKLGPVTVKPVQRGVVDLREDGVVLGTTTTQAHYGFDLPPNPAEAQLTKDEKRRQPVRPITAAPLLLLYPIDKNSKKNPNRGDRKDLEAVHDILAIAMAFPAAPANTKFDYVQANLVVPEVPVEEEELLSDVDDG